MLYQNVRIVLKSNEGITSEHDIRFFKTWKAHSAESFLGYSNAGSLYEHMSPSICPFYRQKVSPSKINATGATWVDYKTAYWLFLYQVNCRLIKNKNINSSSWTLLCYHRQQHGPFYRQWYPKNEYPHISLVLQMYLLSLLLVLVSKRNSGL